MSIRNLDCLFDPRSVAVFGASPRPASVGATVWRNLREGGYAGALFAVNPKYREIDGQSAYKKLSALPVVPELAVICTPPATVPGLVARLARAGTRAAVVLTAGLDAASRQAMLDAARPSLLRILGPNGIGLLAPHIGLNASVAHIGATAGPLAFISQSAALVTAMLDWAQGRGIGFSQVVSLGGQADVDFGDMLDYLATDPHTRAILLYIESLQAPRKFMSAARAAARNKPVLVVKAGRSADGRHAASHHGAQAASDLVFDAAIRRAGMLRVDTLQDLFVAAETLAQFRGMPPAHEVEARERLTIVSNSRGAGVLAADAADQAGVVLAPLPDAVRQALDAAALPDGPCANPVDLKGDSPIGRYVQAVGTLLDARDCGTLLFLHAPSALVPSAGIAQALLPLARATPQRMLSSWLGEAAVADARRQFRQAGIPTYETPEQAVRAFSWLVTYRRNQEQLMEAPPAPSAGGRAAQDGIDLPRVRAIVDAVLAAGRQVVSAPEAIDLLAACGVPVVATGVVAASADAAAAAASAIGFPVALKILSPQIGRKSQVGGVALELFDADAVRAAATVMQARLAHLRPDAKVAGFTVQPMVRRPQALELIVSASIDPLFGPVLLFGQGGSAADVVADRAVALPPLSLPLARALVARTRVSRLLAGWRDVPPADTEALHAVLVALAQLLADEPRIAELDINPLWVDAQGVIALDARVRVDAAGPGGASHFAIRPYPRELVEAFEWQGRTLTLRPIRPEDEAQHRAFLERLDPQDIRMRVFYSRRTMERSELARLTQIDYEREMAFVATVSGPEGIEETLAVVRATIDPDNVEAEFGIVVRSDLKGGGLGERLMKKLIQHLRQRGTQRLVATVLRENERMLELAYELGFELDAARAEPDTHAIFLPLQG